MQIKQQALEALRKQMLPVEQWMAETQVPGATAAVIRAGELVFHGAWGCLLYTSPSPRDA